MPTAAVYVRVSTEPQSEEDKASVPEQLKACRQYAEQHGLDVAQEYEEHFSGQTIDRPELKSLLADLPRFDVVIVYDSTRLARSKRAALDLREALGQKLRLVVGDTSEMAEERDLMEAVQDAMSSTEVKRLTRRTKMGREGRAKLGKHTGRLPAGWKAIRDERGHSIGAEHDSSFERFYHDLERLFLSGTPYSKLGRELAAIGHLTPSRQLPYTIPALRWILGNPMNAGRLVYRHTVKDAETITVDGAFDPWWSDPAAVETEYNRRLGMKGRSRERKHLLSGVLTCSTCGLKLRADTRRGHVTYRCGKHQNFKSGNSSEDCLKPQRISEMKAMGMIEHLFETLPLWGDGQWQQFLQDLHGTNGSEQAIAAATDRLAVLETEEQHLLDNLSKLSGRAATTLRKKLESTSEEIDQVRHTLANLKAKRVVLPDRQAMLAALVKDIPSMKPFELQALILKFAPGGLEVRDRKIPLLWEVLEWADAIDSPLVRTE